MLTGGRTAAGKERKDGKEKERQLTDLQRTTDLLSGLLVQEARALDARRQAQGSGDMKALRRSLRCSRTWQPWPGA